ncbi:MAG: hypothetical protein HYU31_06905 [Deltaproteobacteria bacterium]|nr:hypothetical protein [Deltaproteobacteria bacterium]
MRLLPKLILLLIGAPPLAVLSALYLAIDRNPTIDRAAEITPANIERAKRVFEQNDPRRLKSGARGTIVITQNDLDLAANYLAHRYGDGSARVTLGENRVAINASLCRRQLPIGLCINVDTALHEGAPLPRFEQLRVGRLPVPGPIADWLLMRTIVLLFGQDTLDAGVQALKKFAVQKGRLAVTYEWQEKFKEEIRNVLVPLELRDRLRRYQRRLSEVARGPTNATISLTDLLAPLFQLAKELSQAGNPIEENRAAIFVLTFYVTGKQLDAIIPEAKAWPQPQPYRVILSGREDTPKHFIVSAALAAKAGGPLADALGIYKELTDSQGGSGFSFNDIAADRAGTRFGELAANDQASARILQNRLAAQVREKDIMPPAEDLPENMQAAEFNRRFGGVDTPEFKRMMAKIERRIAALPLYR